MVERYSLDAIENAVSDARACGWLEMGDREVLRPIKNVTTALWYYCSEDCAKVHEATRALAAENFRPQSFDAMSERLRSQVDRLGRMADSSIEEFLTQINEAGLLTDE